MFSSSAQLVYSIHTIWLPSCHSAIHSVHQQPKGSGVAYKQLASQEFKCNPGKQMWCNIQHSARLTPVICPNFMALQFDDSFLDSHVCIPLPLLNTLTHACGDSIFPLRSLTFYSALYEVWTICHRTRNMATMSASMFHSLCLEVHLLIVETPEMTLCLVHLVSILALYRSKVVQFGFAVTDCARFNFIFLIKFKETSANNAAQQKPNAKILCSW